MVECQVQPEADWKEYSARRIGSMVYESLKTARQKCAIAESTSDLNSDKEGRKRRFAKVWSSDSEEEDLMSSWDRGSKRKAISSPLRFETSSPLFSTPSTSALNGKELPASKEGSKRRETDGKRAIEEEILRNVIFIRKSLASFDDRLKALESVHKKCQVNLSCRESSDQEVRKNSQDWSAVFPVKSLGELDELEIKLADSGYRQEVIKELSVIDGASVKELIIRILKLALDDSIAAEFSWLGKKQKRAFTHLKLKDVIVGAVRCTKWADVSVKEVEIIIMEWLKHAKSRVERRTNKDNGNVQN